MFLEEQIVALALVLVAYVVGFVCGRVWDAPEKKAQAEREILDQAQAWRNFIQARMGK